MMGDKGFDRVVSVWLHEDAEWTSPAYLDEVLAETRLTRQRPSWASLERWLPVESGMWPLANAWAGRLTIIIVALLAALAAAAVYVGSQPSLPPPFGLAGNGAILYGAPDGDLYALDIDSGRTTHVVADGAKDETPDFSHDGTRFVFARQADAAVGLWTLMVADADGTHVRALTGPIDPRWNTWSPDDTQVAVVDAAGQTPSLRIYYLDGRPPLTLDIGGWTALYAAFRADGREIVFLGSQASSFGIFAVSTNGASATRPIVGPVDGSKTITNPKLSPSGTSLVYTRWENQASVIHVVDVATGVDRAVKLDPTSDGENTGEWSPDGALLVFHRHGSGSFQLAVATITGGSLRLLGPMVPEGTGGADVVFAPDGMHAIARYEGDGSLWLLDLSGGPGTKLDLGTSASVTWQRIAR